MSLACPRRVEADRGHASVTLGLRHPDGGVILNCFANNTLDIQRSAPGHLGALVRGLLSWGIEARFGTRVRHMAQSRSEQPDTRHIQPRIEGGCRRGDSTTAVLPGTGRCRILRTYAASGTERPALVPSGDDL